MSMTSLTPMLSSLGRWPSFWDDDFSSLVSGGTNSLDIYETEKEVVVKANVAGVPSDKIDVTFEKGVLWIRAEQEQEQDDPKKKHYSRSAWSYSYKVAVPGRLDPGAEPDAMVENGVMTVTFKKAEEVLPKKLNVRVK